MDFQTLGPILGASAPLISKALSFGIGFIPGIGPIAGPIIGPLIGDAIAKQFGVPNTPGDIHAAIAANGGPESEIVKAKLAAATDELKAKYNWMTEIEKGNLQVTQATILGTQELMKAELGHEHWFFNGWRPAMGWQFNFWTAVFGVLLTVATIRVLLWPEDKVLGTIVVNWPVYAAFLAILAAAVGVYIPSRSKEKTTAMENGLPMPNSTLPKLPAPPPAVAPGPIPAFRPKPGALLAPLPMPGQRPVTAREDN